MTITLHTTRATELLRYAAQLERDANASLRRYVLLGQTERYSIAMAQARALRAAAAERSIACRREILRSSGFTLA